MSWESLSLLSVISEELQVEVVGRRGQPTAGHRPQQQSLCPALLIFLLQGLFPNHSPKILCHNKELNRKPVFLGVHVPRSRQGRKRDMRGTRAGAGKVGWKNPCTRTLTGQHWMNPVLCCLPKNSNHSCFVFQSPHLFLTLSLDP